MHPRTLWRVTRRAAEGWWNDNCIRLSASLAYYTALSLAPLVVIVVGLAGLVTERQEVANQLETQLELLMGLHGRQLVHTILTTAEPQGGTAAALIGIVTLLISATAVFGELQAALNLIWEVKPVATDSVWESLWFVLKQRLLSLAIVLAIAFLLLVSLVISAALTGVAAYVRGTEQTLLLGRVLEMALSISVITVLFAVLFKYVPDAQIRWRDVWLGSAVSAGLFTLGKVAIGYYIGRASVGSPYGAAGSLVALLVWVYYSSLIVFFGAEFTQAWATRQHAVVPMPHAEPGAAPQTKLTATQQRAQDCRSGIVA
jgi:membrane protein